jgi:hypothetical protein
LKDSFQAENFDGPLDHETDRSTVNGVTSISWNDSPFEPPKLVVGGYSKMATVWSCNNGRWLKVSAILKQNLVY